MNVIRSILAREKARENLECYYDCDTQWRKYYTELGLSEESLKESVSFWRDMISFDIETAMRNGELF